MIRAPNVSTRIPPRVALILPRLSTEHVGELVSARDALVRSLASAGLDLHDLAAACTFLGDAETPPSPCTRRSPSRVAFGDLARAARDLDRGQLSPRERAFVADMVARGFAFRPSLRQAQWIDDIVGRLQGRAAA